MARDRDDSQRLIEAVATAVTSERTLWICGRGSKTFLGPTAIGDMLNVGDHCGIVDYRPEELVLTARSGTPLTDLRRTLAAQQQMLAFDPPMFAGEGSLGGAVAAGLSGPGRPWYGAVRDAVLGVTVINGLAQSLKFGGQVMKNVAGYDVSRLMAGAFGTLGVLLDVSIKVMPRPLYESTRVFAIDRNTAHAKVVAWARSPLPLTATCHFGDELHVRLSGTERGVRAAAAQIGGDELPHAANFWGSLRDQTHPFFGGGRCYRIVVPPAAEYPAFDGKWLTEWGGAQRWLRSSTTRGEVDAAMRRLGGHATELRPSSGSQPFDEGVLKYYRRLKGAFDPKAVFNRGRLFDEIGR